jgi:hypothetical protein
VRETYASVDTICFCVTADDKIGPGDRFIAAELAQVKTPVIAVVTKTDKVSKQQVGEQLLAVSQLADWAEIVPTSAVSDFQVGLLADLLVARLPEGPPLFPDGELTDEPEQVMIGELIREAALEGVRDELPHSLAVTVEEMNLREDRPRRQAAAGRLRHRARRARQPEGDRPGHRRRPAQGRRHHGPAPDRGAARHAGVPEPARHGEQGLAEGPQAAAQARLLTGPARRRRSAGRD